MTTLPFQTTPDQVVRLAEITVSMAAVGLDRRFVAAISDLARTDQGVFDLLEMWADAEGDDEERDEILADLQESLDDYQDTPSQPLQKPYIPFDALDDVAKDVRAFKKKLRSTIEKHGGVSEVARRTGIPQPSLSRMLNSSSMPRRSTLYKIANALKLPETEIVAEWIR
jgi:DNA-binding phage protein